MAVGVVEVLIEPMAPLWDSTLATAEVVGLLVYQLETRDPLAGDLETGVEVVSEAQLEIVELAEELLGWAIQHPWTFVASHHLTLSRYLEILWEPEEGEQGVLDH